MNESQISVRYAKALFQSASEKKVLDKVNSDMDLLAETCQQEEFQGILLVPTLQPSQKVKLMEQIFMSHVSDVSMAMIKLVITNKRDVYLPGIARNFRNLYRKEMNISSASLVTAEPVDSAALTSIKEMLAKAYEAKVELSASVNEEVIGGFVLTVEDMQYDASVATSLRKFRKQLLQTR